MATITLQYNVRNSVAQSILEVIRKVGVFKVIDDSNPSPSGDPYFLNPANLAAIERGAQQLREGRYKVLTPELEKELFGDV